MLLMGTAKLMAQCDFRPVIRPGNLVMCPNTTDTLATTEAYDSYQWFRNNTPIEGANSRFLVVDYYNAAGALFRVEATLNGCTQSSKKVLVDGWAFLPPYLIESGDIGVYNPKKDVLVECPGDTLLLTFGLPYTENIQWYNNGSAIPGATSADYVVTSRGSYTVCGAPQTCPNYYQCTDLPVNVTFNHPEATITEKNDTLFADGGRQFQWYYQGQQIPGATASYLVPKKAGRYTVSVTNSYNCTDVSKPYLYTSTVPAAIKISPNPVHDMARIKVQTVGGTELVITDLFGNKRVQVPVSNAEQLVNVGNLTTGAYTVQVLDKTGKPIASAKIFKD